MTSDNKISVTLLAKLFVDKYVKSKTQALLWANKKIDKSLWPALKIKVRELLIEKGYKFSGDNNEAS